MMCPSPFWRYDCLHCMVPLIEITHSFLVYRLQTNLAKSTRQKIPIENKILAFRALKQGLKFSFSNWRMWQNYMVVCMDIGELSEACRALGRVVEELSEKKKTGEPIVDYEVMDHLVDAVVKSPVSDDGSNNADSKSASSSTPNAGRGLYPRVRDLFTRTILPRISSSAQVFRAYGRLLVWARETASPTWASDALEAYMNGYRCSVIDDESVETDLERWKVAVGEVKDIVGVQRDIGPLVTDGVISEEVGEETSEKKLTGGNGKWKFQARSLVRSFMARTKSTFGDEPQWEQLVELLDSLKSASI